MASEVRFLLNDADIVAGVPAGLTVLDFVRTHRRLPGTKIGCREGDCGACTVLVGDFADGRLDYRSMTSCLLPIVNVHGKHVVTVEGLNLPDRFNVVQEAMAEHGATQCGFCSVGFVVSLAGYALDARAPHPARVIEAIDGNICRCTGYKSIERAAATVHARVAERPERDPLDWLVANAFVPAWFRDVPARLARLQAALGGGANGGPAETADGAGATAARIAVGGGTDLWVQRPEEMVASELRPLFGHAPGIAVATDRCTVSGATTFTEIAESAALRTLLPGLEDALRLVASTPIRNMATVAGNLVNASPIGDITILFLGLDADVHLEGPAGSRTVPLRAFYRGYKEIDRQDGEILAAVSFALPTGSTRFHFQKISKRTHLDIASVNSAARFELRDGRIERAALAAGGVAPVPLSLARTAAALAGRSLTADTAHEAAEIALGEIAPISDARGSADYKRLLVRQMVLDHCVACADGAIAWEEVL